MTMTLHPLSPPTTPKPDAFNPLSTMKRVTAEHIKRQVTSYPNKQVARRWLQMQHSYVAVRPVLMLGLSLEIDLERQLQLVDMCFALQKRYKQSSQTEDVNSFLVDAGLQTVHDEIDRPLGQEPDFDNIEDLDSYWKAYGAYNLVVGLPGLEYYAAGQLPMLLPEKAMPQILYRQAALQQESVQHLWNLQLDGWAEIIFGTSLYYTMMGWEALKHMNKRILPKLMKELAEGVAHQLGNEPFMEHVSCGLSHVAPSNSDRKGDDEDKPQERPAFDVGADVTADEISSLHIPIFHMTDGMQRSATGLMAPFTDIFNLLGQDFDQAMALWLRLQDTMQRSTRQLAEALGKEPRHFHQLPHNEILKELEECMNSAQWSRPWQSRINMPHLASAVLIGWHLPYTPEMYYGTDADLRALCITLEPTRHERAKKSLWMHAQHLNAAMGMAEKSGHYALHTRYELFMDFLEGLGVREEDFRMPFALPRLNYWKRKRRTLGEPTDAAPYIPPRPQRDEPPTDEQPSEPAPSEEHAAGGADGGADAAPDELA